MNPFDLLRATRDVYVLIEKPSVGENPVERFWSLCLDGLHKEHFCEAVNRLRKECLPRADSKQKKTALKPVALLNALSRALGGQSYDHWLEVEQPRIADFLCTHNLSLPTNLVSWSHAPGFAGALTARQLSDRLFSSGLALPKRIFTGVGCGLFSASSYGRLDIDQIAGATQALGQGLWTDEQRFDFCRQYADQVLVRAEHMKAGGELAYLDLTGRMLMLNAVSELIGGMYNLLGDNLMDPLVAAPVIRSYNASAAQQSFDQQLFRLFREQIEASDEGWVDVLPVPGNPNLIFLRGTNGRFDWLVRNQRNAEFSSNPHYPFFTKPELPKAMDRSKLQGHLYFSSGLWTERLQHEAEERHYSQGGTAADWPGYEALIERELISSRGYCQPRPETGSASRSFIAHRCTDYCLMVSPLITIAQFNAFQERTGWDAARQAKAAVAGCRIDDLASINTDANELPVSVTWLDAVAYCRDFEQRSGLPVRLMSAADWRQVAPAASVDLSQVNAVRRFTVEPGTLPCDPIYEQLGWAIVGGDGRLGGNSAHCYRPEGIMRFMPALNWVASAQGTPFLSVPGFGEWLGDYQHGAAPVACAATHQSIVGGAIERNLCPVHLTMSYKGAKIGFRLCYAAHLDA
ncbi:SUMF1/EgtB/PvdO family nonheme iron enzyme [Pseudomonas sp. LPH60]|uniref:SUMF1/EgtB/PvdO family nonheme iron enzyme n=1 Tax=Pseudomonas sp. LPH60 TaxID=3065906 RepID=UPI00273A798C|nr:SUMF1/EgtB/PvdO family nonheme iron enzyme [Pseudomonas sp. LPH60]MDP4572935.1 SUMF1/EgtB/PvdO family nonheme iron enzyme [Pseudomonas sp. LPH60]